MDGWLLCWLIGILIVGLFAGWLVNRLACLFAGWSDNRYIDQFESLFAGNLFVSIRLAVCRSIVVVFVYNFCARIPHTPVACGDLTNGHAPSHTTRTRSAN